MAGSVFAALLWCLSPVAVDGDTVRCGDSATRIRLWGIQAAGRGQPGADVAKASLQKWIAGGIVCQPRGASYQRAVGICYNGQDRDIGMQMLKVDRVVIEWCSYTVSRQFPAGYYETCPVSPNP